MAFDWRSITKSKPAMIGIAAAGGLGLFVFLKRGGSSSGSTATPTGSTTPTISGAADTTGTDVASWLSSYGQTLVSTQQALLNQQTNTGATGTTSSGNTTSGTTATAGNVGQPPQRVQYHANQGETLAQLAKNSGTTTAQLKSLNPKLKDWADTRALPFKNGTGYGVWLS